MKKKTILLVVLLLAVGFAAVTTTLFINGTTNIGTNKSDFDVYYSKAKVNGVEDNSVIQDDTHIVFTQEMKKVGETYVLDYDVTNGSRNYDASLTMTCTESNEYLSVTNAFDTDTTLPATETRTGKLTIELIKGYVGETTKEVTIECTINANAVERSSQGTNTVPEKVTSSKAWVAITGDGTNVGDEIAVGDEHFYVISNDGTTLNALAKYNLNVGSNAVSGTTGIQNSAATGYVSGGSAPYPGAVAFSDNKGWTYANNDDINIKDYAGPVKIALYDENTGYEKYIQQTVPNATVRLITKSELEGLGCNSSSNTCSEAPAWVTSSSYWTGSANARRADIVWIVNSDGFFIDFDFNYDIGFGVRPVITLES